MREGSGCVPGQLMGDTGQLQNYESFLNQEILDMSMKDFQNPQKYTEYESVPNSKMTYVPDGLSAVKQHEVHPRALIMSSVLIS